MSNDISTMYTKEQNKQNGRRGWIGWCAEKETCIEPSKYGEYILKHRKRGKRK